MNALTAATENAVPAAPLLFEQLPVIREMLSMLETSSTAGQHYVMSTVIGFIEDRSSGLLRSMSPRNRRALMDLLTHLKRECERISPEIPIFVLRAEGLLSLLAAVA